MEAILVPGSALAYPTMWCEFSPGLALPVSLTCYGVTSPSYGEALLTPVKHLMPFVLLGLPVPCKELHN